jgi:MFS family permease
MIFWNFGYDGGILSGILAMPTFVEHFASGKLPNGSRVLTPFDISVITAVPQIGILVGIPFASFGADRWGRRAVTFVACAMALLAAALQVAANEIILYTVGRTFGSELIMDSLLTVSYTD